MNQTATSYITRLVTITEPLLLPPMAPDTLDTRGLDLWPTLYLDNDTVSSITRIVVSRADRLPLSSNDLTAYPANSPPPWVSANLAGVPSSAVQWWQSVGEFCKISQDGCQVEYLLTVSLVTVAGRHLTITATQFVPPTVS